MKKLSINQVRDVAHLARLTLKEEEVMKYQKELGQILTEIEKINQAEVSEDEEMLICPTTNETITIKERWKQNEKKGFFNLLSVAGSVYGLFCLQLG